MIWRAETGVKQAICATCLLVADLIHELEALQGLLDGDAHVLLRQGDGPVGGVKVEQAHFLLHPQEGGHVLIVGQGGAEPD